MQEDLTTLSKRFYELTGICEHKWIPCAFSYDEWQCSKCRQVFSAPLPADPDFSDAREVIKVMREREDWHKFFNWLVYKFTYDQLIDRITDRTGLLRDEAVRWMEERG